MDPCTPTRPAHRAWRRFWLLYASVTFTTGVVADIVAYVRGGYPATLTCWVRSTFGLEPRARYGSAGQVFIGGFLAWALIHLTTGWLGPSRGRAAR